MPELSAPTPPDYLQLLVSRVESAPNQTKLIYFETGAIPFQYQAGQYVTLILQTRQGDFRRSYSLFSVPAFGEQPAIGVKRVENGLFSRYLYDTVKAGDVLLSSGTGGFFTLPEDLSPFRQVFFFAAGVGITPVFSLLTTLLKTTQLAAVLVYSNRTEQDVIFKQELEQLASEFSDRFRLILLLSNSPKLARARLYPELLIELVQQHALAPPGQLLSFICGPLNYLRMCTYGLRRAGFSAEAIRKENFISNLVRPEISPPDKEPHEVTIRYLGVENTVKVQFPDSILKAARKVGLNLPYSCEGGVCGNCVARCLEGHIWLSYNEVLTQKDLNNGLTLTCVGYPVGGNARLEI